MYTLAMKRLPVAKIPRIITSQAHELDCSISIQDMSLALSNQDSKRQVICITGHPGSGRSTYTQALVQEIISNGVVKDSEVLYFEVGQYDSVNSVWNTAIDIGKASGDRNTVALLASNVTTQQAKLKATASILNNFKIICFDCVSAANEELFTLLLALVKESKSSVFCISNLKASSKMKIGADVLITVNGLCPHAVKRVAQEKIKVAVDSEGFKRSCEGLLYNPKAVQLYINHCNEFGIHEITEEASISHLLEMIWGRLSDIEKDALCQLSELRQPLPMKSEANTLERIVRMGLVSEKAISEESYCLVFMSNAVRDFVQAKGPLVSKLRADEKFSVLDCWTALLTEELMGLVNDARNNSWPFIPEKWQYVTDAGEKESYNVNDLIVSKNQDLPHLTYFDILQECLHHSTVKKNYEHMAAIIFVLDRFIYWRGGSKMLLSIVDSITEGNPLLPIAPQLVFRKARILRTSGDLQGAERSLDKLLNEKEKVGVWRYKEKHDHHLIRAVCIQIKGEIQASLGQWVTAASLLLDSVHDFKTLPKVDKKGLSCSLGLLVNALQNMSTEEYQSMVGKYALTSPHPYHQAYVFACEAADMAMYTPLFYARHKRRAGEMMLEYSQLFTDHARRSELLDQSLGELKESLKAHKSLEYLKSREQFYELICALHKISCVFKCETEQPKRGEDLKSISILLYDHYCRHQVSVVHDAFTQRLINTALFILGLPKLADDASGIDSVPSTSSSRGDLKEPAKIPSAQASERHVEANADTVDRCAETLRDTVVVSNGSTTVDRIKTTVDAKDDVRNEASINQETYDLTAAGVHECESSRYDPVHFSWRTQRTLVYIGEQLNLAEGTQGAQRDPFMVEYLNQDEPLGKYVGKKYKKALGVEQYEEDVRCQMTARYYVRSFNQDLYQKGVETSQIEFLPVVMLRLLGQDGHKAVSIYNAEPYIHGNFTKITNNWGFVDREGQGSKLLLAFSHFTYEKSNHSLLIVDHQGWTSSDHLSTTFLTDPQIHSVDKKHFGTGNLGQRGIAKFWKDIHKECNEICLQLGLSRSQCMATPTIFSK